MKKILVIQGHPNEKSYCSAIANAYIEGKNLNGEISFLKLNDLKFDPILRLGYQGEQPLEEDLKMAQEKIKWADHLVFIYPNWWGNPPALLKGFIDRVFLPGFAFKYSTGALPTKLLQGKTSELIITLDTPVWFYRFFMGAPGVKIMTKSILGFCGIKNQKVTFFGPVRGSTDEKRKSFLNYFLN